MMRIIHALLAAILLLCRQTQCALHYCGNGGTKSLVMKADSDQSEMVHAYLRGARPGERMRHAINCRWQFSVDGVKPGRPVQMTVRAFMIEEPGSPEASGSCSGTGMRFSMADSPCPIEVNSTMTNSSFFCDETTAPDITITIPIYKSSNTLSVYYRRELNSAAGVQALEVNIAKRNNCGPNMLLFNDRCHFVTNRAISLTEAENVWRQFKSSRLAGFESVAEIEAFLQANIDRAKLYPYRPPLKFERPIRIGLCRHGNSDNSRLAFWSFRNGCYVGKLATNLTYDQLGQPGAAGDTQSDALCVTLQASPAAPSVPVLNATPCNTALPSLMSFDELPLLNASEYCAAGGDCGGDRVDWKSISFQRLRAMRLETVKASPPKIKDNGLPLSRSIPVIGSVLASVFIIAILLIFYKLYCKKRNTNPEDAQADYSSLPQINEENC